LNLQLTSVAENLHGTVSITGSKSESNRWLILQQLYNNCTLQNCSNADDTQYLQEALKSTEPVIDIGHAGTAMRFLTAFFATQEGKTVVLTGSKRMQERPIKILVDALLSLGASITYENKIGFPPLRIEGKKITKNKVAIQGDVSSQYLSALLLVAPSLPNGLELELQGEITSVPYLKMTVALLQRIGVSASFEGNSIQVLPQEKIQHQSVVIESDWSAASYYYSLVALSPIGTQIRLQSFYKDSLQADACLQTIYKKLGVDTQFIEQTLMLTKTEACTLAVQKNGLTLHLADAPDSAQTIAVTCFGLQIPCLLTGLHTLKIKETDRLLALQTELTKLGAVVTITNESLQIEAATKINENIQIGTYQDHRMAMAFTPLVLKAPLVILEAAVVSKSYPDFWKDMQRVGIQFEELK